MKWLWQLLCMPLFVILPGSSIRRGRCRSVHRDVDGSRQDDKKRGVP